VDVLTSSADYSLVVGGIRSANEKDQLPAEELALACDKLKQACLIIPLDAAQEQTLQKLSDVIITEFQHGLAAVRSSAIEEDGSDLSYAGMFETELGVTASKLEWAVRHCFASKFDIRVFRYMGNHIGASSNDAEGFALVVMEMIDSTIAGVCE